MRGPRRSLMLAIPLAALLVASCGESSSAEAAPAAAPAAAMQAVEKIVIKEVPVERVVVKEVPVERLVTQQVEKVVTQTVAVEKVVAASTVQGSDPASAASNQASTGSLLSAETQVPDSGRKVIRNAAIGIVVTDVPTSVKAIRGIVASISGCVRVSDRDCRQSAVPDQFDHFAGSRRAL